MTLCVSCNFQGLQIMIFCSYNGSAKFENHHIFFLNCHKLSLLYIDLLHIDEI